MTPAETRLLAAQERAAKARRGEITKARLRATDALHAVLAADAPPSVRRKLKEAQA